MKCLKIPNTKAFAEVRRRTEARREKTNFFFFLLFREKTRADANNNRVYALSTTRPALVPVDVSDPFARGYDGHTHWARTLLDDAHALGPRKPVT